MITIAVLRSSWGDEHWLGIIGASIVMCLIVQTSCDYAFGAVRRKFFPNVHFERWTDRSRNLLSHANQEAFKVGADSITPEHLLLALTDDQADGAYKPNEGVAAAALKSLNVDLSTLRSAAQRLIKSEAVPMSGGGKLPLAPRSKRIIDWAMEESRSMKHNYSGTEHILLALLRDKAGPPALVLAAQHVTYENARVAVLSVLGPPANP